MLSFRSLTNDGGSPDVDISGDKILFVGTMLGMFGYGIHVTLYFLCMSSFYGSRQRDPKLSWFYMVYITTNFIIGSIANALNVLLAETVFVDGRNVPGGALAALAIYDHLVITQVCFAFYMINSWTQDGLLLYRFYIIFGQRLTTVVIPLCLYTASIIFSCLLLWQLTVPTAGFFAHTSVNFGTVFWSMSIGTTVLLTTLIVLRLLYMKIRTYKTLKQQDSTPYLSLSATLIESASLYSIIGLLFLVFYNKGSATQNLFLSFLGQVESISPLLIAWRVAQRRAWTRKTLEVSTRPNLSFSHSGEEKKSDLYMSNSDTTSHM